jgi:hypothetical protein
MYPSLQLRGFSTQILKVAEVNGFMYFFGAEGLA